MTQETPLPWWQMVGFSSEEAYEKRAAAWRKSIDDAVYKALIQKDEPKPPQPGGATR